MSYIADLRLIVGKRPLLLVGAAVLIFDRQNRLLMMRRTDNGAWGIPGGALELGESLETTATRETFEELGLAVGKLTLLDVFSGPELYYRYPNGDEVFNISAVYIAGEVSGEIRLDGKEHSEYGYYALDELPVQISPPLIPVLRRLRSNLCSLHKPETAT